MIKIFQFIAQFIVLGLAVAFVAVYLRPDLLPALEPAAAPSAPHSYANAVNATAPSVVSIYTRTLVTQPLFENLSDPLYRALYQERTVTLPRRGLGSGVIVSPDGLILTTRHVISDVDNIVVALFDGRIAEARVVGSDPGTDLAVLKIEMDNLPAASLATDANLRTGDVVLAIGNAFGLSHTVTMGIVSATGRGQLNLTTFEDFIQTDAAINAGNSGGALVNPAGQVVGINSASLSQSIGAQGISFAIPAPLASQIMTQIVEYGQVQRGWIGVDLMDLSLALQLGERTVTGARVARAAAGSPAWEAGLRPGDILISADGDAVSSARELTLLISQRTPGSSIEFEVVRGRQLFTTSVDVIQQPPLGTR
ncbi:S1C family serine protease [Wenzhouxiangella marina]|uniref:S1C family serine protease n=1 Tax=Wenzhouxiangella marina TaxID=1579979 RepID=UPI0006736CF0|nr:trypsin-like peptidase domain-containing protein [Wenzhouxiangella marina]MBB6086566.1 serine peptidase DegS [Wenzhouxiangella marina]